MVVEVDEGARGGEAPADYVRRVAIEKSAAAEVRVRAVATCAASGFNRIDDSVVILAADTAVVVDGEILGKPRDDREASRMLRLLSGRAHEVLTGISLRRNGRELGGVIRTEVWFSTLTDADIAWYIGSGEGRDKNQKKRGSSFHRVIILARLAPQHQIAYHPVMPFVFMLFLILQPIPPRLFETRQRGRSRLA